MNEGETVSCQHAWINSIVAAGQGEAPFVGYSASAKFDGKYEPGSNRLVHHRQVAQNEIVLDLDAEEWNANRDAARKLLKRFKAWNIPNYPAYTGGKGIHIHIFFDPGRVGYIHVSEKLSAEDAAEAKAKLEGVDQGQIAREHIARLLLKAAPSAKYDKKLFDWTSDNKGHLIREFGGVHQKTGAIKTLLKSIPEDRPAPGSYEVVIPREVVLWRFDDDNTKPIPGAVSDRIRAEAEKVRTDEDAEERSFQEYKGGIRDIPCACWLIENGARKDTIHDTYFKMSVLSRVIDLPEADALAFLHEISDHSETGTGNDNDISNTLASVYHKELKRKIFGCKDLRVLHPFACARKDCPIWQQNTASAEAVGSLDEQLKREARRTHLLNQAEPFIYEDGRFGFYIPDHGPECIHSLDEWAALVDNNLKDKLMDIARGRETMPWLLPGEPHPTEQDPTLMEDLVSYIKDYVEFPQERLYYALAAWIICTYITERLSHAPRWNITAPTAHGKGRCLAMGRLLAYRCVSITNPTPAVLFRFTGWYRATVMIDEFQDLQASHKEFAADVMTIYKVGFDVGACVPRMNNDNTDIDNFGVFSFMMVASKKFNFKEDEMNRAVMVTMRKRTRDLKENPMNIPASLDEAAALRTRLHAFRVRVLQGLENVAEWKEMADSLIKKPVFIPDPEPILTKPLEEQGEHVDLEDRQKEKAAALLIPCVQFGHSDYILQVMAESQKKAKTEQGNTMSAEVFHALQALLLDVVNTRLSGDESPRCTEEQMDAVILGDPKTQKRGLNPEAIREKLNKLPTSTVMIRDQFIRDLVNGNASGDDDPIPDGRNALVPDSMKKKYELLEAKYSTKLVSKILREELGFETKIGSKGKSFLVGKNFLAAYRSCLQSFGSRYLGGI